jgi:hemerythrin-like domain-containing protein
LGLQGSDITGAQAPPAVSHRRASGSHWTLFRRLHRREGASTIRSMPQLFQVGQSQTPDFTDPIGMLVACHRRIEKHLAIVARSLGALRGGDAALVHEARRALRVAQLYFDGPAVLHAQDEEASLFPRLQHALVHELALEHREHEAIYLALRSVMERLQSEVTPALCDELELHLTALTHVYMDHMRREEDELFPVARRLELREMRAIGLEMRLRRGGRPD